MKKAFLILLSALLLFSAAAFAQETAVTLEPVPADSAAVARETADRMEEKFGVAIALEGEVPEDILADLGILEDALGKYSEQFFSVLKDRNHPDGLLITLTGADGGEAQPAECRVGERDGRYGIFLAYGGFSGMTVHHAVWHALEKAIKAKYLYAFSDWTLLNPQSFVYPYDYSANTEEYDETYFARGYGTVSQEEDRATIFEATFYENFEEWVTGKTGILYKLNYMVTFLNMLAEQPAAE